MSDSAHEDITGTTPAGGVDLDADVAPDESPALGLSPDRAPITGEDEPERDDDVDVEDLP